MPTAVADPPWLWRCSAARLGQPEGVSEKLKLLGRVEAERGAIPRRFHVGRPVKRRNIPPLQGSRRCSRLRFGHNSFRTGCPTLAACVARRTGTGTLLVRTDEVI